MTHEPPLPQPPLLKSILRAQIYAAYCSYCSHSQNFNNSVRVIAPNRVISRFEHVPWSPRLPDLTMCAFFFGATERLHRKARSLELKTRFENRLKKEEKIIRKLSITAPIYCVFYNLRDKIYRTEVK